MIIEFDRSFEKTLDKIRDYSLFPKIEKIILAIEKAHSITDLTNVKKLSGFKNYYRFRIGVYRLGFEKIDDQTIRFIIIAHRKDIYKYYP